MTNNHQMKYCEACQRPFYTERSGEFCAACLLTIFEQADFTGVAKPTYFTVPPDAPITLTWQDGSTEVLDGKSRLWTKEWWLHTEDATPTQRLDTDGGDDATL